MDQQSLKDIPQNQPIPYDLQMDHQKNSFPTEPAKKIPKMRGPPKGSKRRPHMAVGIKSGLWNINQMKAYLKFITRFENHFRDKFTRKKKKIFHRMSNFIKSRTSEQCRSHHQKLEIKFITHQGIIQYIQNEIKTIIQLTQKGLNHLDQQIEGERSFIKLENVSASQEMVERIYDKKPIEKKTQLEQDQPQEFYQITEERNVLLINIEEQKIEIWQ